MALQMKDLMVIVSRMEYSKMVELGVGKALLSET
jgi:hypothetical protein